MAKVEFVAESAARGDNTEISGERLVNCWAEPAPVGGRAAYVIRAMQGYSATPFADLGDEVVRAAVVSGGILYIVAKGFLYSVDEAGTVTKLTFIDDDTETTMAALNGEVAIAGRGRYFVWNGARSEPFGAAFDGAGSVTTLNNRILMSEPDGRKIGWTGLLDPNDLDGLNFTTKEAREDKVVAVQRFEGNVWVFGETSTEVFYDTGDANNQFERVPNAVIEHGLKGKRLKVTFQDRLFYIASDNTVREGVGAAGGVVSTPAVHEALNAEAPVNVSAYISQSNQFIVVRFANRPAWVLNLSTGLWSERKTGVGEGAWEIAETIFAHNKWLAITTAGAIYELANVYKDGAQEMQRVMRSRPLDLESDRLSVPKIEYRIQTGQTDIGRDLAFMHRYSKDGGNTFTPFKQYGLGGQGDYARRGAVRSLGSMRNLTTEIVVTDAAQMDVESSAVAQVV